MSQTDEQDAITGLRALRPEFINRRMKVTGYLNTDGSLLAPNINARDGYMWVHGYPRGANVQVLVGANINPYAAGARVWVGENHAKQAVAYAPVVDRNSTQQWGTGLPGLATPVNVPTLAVIEGRLQSSELGGMYVHVNPFTYASGYWAGGTWSAGTLTATTYDFDVTSYTPTTNGNVRWVRVWFDPTATAATALHAVAGAEVYQNNNVWLLDEALIGAIAIPAGMYAVGAVALYYGQTDLAGGRFASAREILNAHDAGGQWVIDYAATIPAPLTAAIPRGITITATGCLTVLGSLYII